MAATSSSHKELEAGEGDAAVAKDDSVLTPRAAFSDLVSGNGPPLRVLFLAMVIEFASFAMVIPVLPFFLIHELKMDAGEVGLLLSAASFAALVGAWISGRISDATGRYPILVIAFAWAGIGLALTSRVQTFWEIFAVRLAQGLSGGTFALCDAYVLDVTTEHNRAAYIGLVGAVKGVAFLIGPGSGAALVASGVTRRTVFVIAGSGAFLSAVISLFFLPESLPESKRRPLVQNCAEQGKECCNSAEFEVVNKGLSCIWFCRFTSAMGLGFLYATYAFLIKDNFGWGDVQFGIVLVAGGAVGALLQALVFPQLVATFGASRVLCLGGILGTVAYALLPEPIILVHMLALACFQLASACVEPSFPVLIGEYVHDQYFGFANGGTTSFRSLATIITPLIAGGLYEMSARHAYYSGAVCFALAATGAVPILFRSEEEKPLLGGAVGLKG